MITINPESKLLILDSASASAQEIYSRWVDWIALSDNLKYLPAFTAVGGDDLGGGLAIPPYFFLRNGWRVRPMEANHTLLIAGNLPVFGGGVPVVPTVGNYNVSVQYTVPVQAQAFSASGSTGPTAGEIASALLAIMPTTMDISVAVWEHMIEANYTAADIQRVLAAMAAGKISGAAGSTITIRDINDTKNRIEANVDQNGNRLSVAVDAS